MGSTHLVLAIVATTAACLGAYLLSGWFVRRRLGLGDDRWRRLLEGASAEELREMLLSLDYFSVDMPKGRLRGSPTVMEFFEALDRDGPTAVAGDLDRWLTRLSQEEKRLGWDTRPMLMDYDETIRDILGEMVKREAVRSSGRT